jgi:hypothetical protein
MPEDDMAMQRVVTDIPGDEVDRMVEDFESETVTRKQQADGLWTVTASCPDSR